MSQDFIGRRSLSMAFAAGIAIAVLVAVVAMATGQETSSDTPSLDRSAEVYSELDPSKPRNVMLLVLDGFDDQMMTAARNYLVGADGRFLMDGLPFVGDMTTHGFNPGPGPDYWINYVNDSAATATAFATGHKTIEGRISQGPSQGLLAPGEDLESVLLRHKAEGKLTANITTVDVTDATAAAFGASVNNRSCEGPENMTSCSAARKVNGGKGSIAEQMVDNGVDVIMGGGRARFEQSVDAGGSLLDYSTNTLGYQYVGTKDQMEGVSSLDGGPVLGLFASGYMTTRFAPLIATAAPGSGSDSYRCVEQSRGTQPKLSEMVDKAIGLIDNPNGFFLHAESASVDKREHNSDICGSIGEVAEAEDALQVMLDFQEENPDTLIVVTSDHGHATQIVRGAGDARLSGTVQTEDGDPMMVGYSTSSSAGGQWHTGTQLRVAAKGPQAANVMGTIDQVDLYHVLAGLTPSLLPVDDEVPPTSTASTSPAPGGTNGWHVSAPVSLTIAATDNEGGAGVDFIEYSGDAGGSWSTYGGPVNVSAQGASQYLYRAVDRMGNTEDANTIEVKIDSQAPSSSHSLNPESQSPRVLTLAGTDPEPGSGIGRFEYSLTGGATWIAYNPSSRPSFPVPGSYQVLYRAIDAAGNQEVGTNLAEFRVTHAPAPLRTNLRVTAKPKNKKVKAGKNVNLRIQVANRGKAAATRVRVCAQVPKKKARVNNKAKRCVTKASIAAGRSWTPRFKVKKTAKGKSAKVKVVVSARNAPNRKAQATVRLK